jgi:hypothetical protein
MELVPTGSGGEVVAVAAATFLVLLAAFIALMTCIACRYHARKPACTPQARGPRGLAAARADQPQVTPAGGRSPARRSPQ